MSLGPQSASFRMTPEKEDCSIWWRIGGQLVVGFVGALHRDIVEQERRGQHRLRNLGCVGGNRETFAFGLDTGPQRSLIEVVEHGSADEGAFAIEVDSIEQAWSRFGA